MLNESFIGIDVSKGWLDVGVLPEGSTQRVVHDEAGIVALCDRVRSLTPTLVVLEATGGLETRLASALAAAEVAVAVVNPRQVRD